MLMGHICIYLKLKKKKISVHRSALKLQVCVQNSNLITNDLMFALNSTVMLQVVLNIKKVISLSYFIFKVKLKKLYSE